MLSKHHARVFFFYFAKKKQAAEFLDTVRGSVAQIHRQISAVAPRRVDVDGDSDDEVEELVKLVRRVGVENEEPNKKAVDIEEPDKKANDEGSAEDVEDEDSCDSTFDEYDPYSSMVESQLWPYDPNAASGIRGRYNPNSY